LWNTETEPRVAQRCQSCFADSSHETAKIPEAAHLADFIVIVQGVLTPRRVLKITAYQPNDDKENSKIAIRCPSKPPGFKDHTPSIPVKKYVAVI
jgi:hypothetical protein